MQKKEWEECGPRVGADITTAFDCDNIAHFTCSCGNNNNMYIKFTLQNLGYRHQNG